MPKFKHNYFICVFCLYLASSNIVFSNGGKQMLPIDTAEKNLIEVLNAYKLPQWSEAWKLSEKACKEHPKFRPGLLLNKYIQNQQTLPFPSISSIKPQQDEFIESNVLLEIQRRLQARLIQPYLGKYPSSLILLDPEIENILIVDAQKSRLYFLSNQSGEPAVIADYFSGIGKQGYGKQIRGDYRTPIGVYSFTNKISDQKLQEKYGIGAMPLNYPNTWDLIKKRTGSGIWLHGVPRNTYSRPPYSSRGCITLSNYIYDAVEKHVVLNQTPVIVTENEKWIEKKDWADRQQLFVDTVERWRKDWASLNFDAYIAHYARSFQNERNDYSDWYKQKSAIHSKKKFIQVAIENLNLYQYPGEKNLIQADFTQDYQSNNFSSRHNKRQYWKLIGNNWKIIYEGAQ